MKTSLDRFIDPENYYHDAVADAAKGGIADIEAGLLIIRLGLELRRPDAAAAQAVITRLDGENRQGYELFQLMTGKLILALWTKDDAAIMAALEGWLDARRPAPGSWRHDALAAPELAPYLAKTDPAALALPETKPYRVTKADRAMVKDFAAARVQAVTENLHWLREIGVTGTIRAIAKAYRIVHANHALREVTLGSDNEDWPDMIVALDGDGAVIGSFLAH